MWFNKTLGSTKRWKLAFTWRTTPVQTDSAVSVRRRNTLPEFVDGSWAQTLISSGGYYGFWAVREPVCVRVRVCACARVWAGPVWRSSFLFLFSFLNLRSCLIYSFFGEVIERKSGPREEKTREREVTVPPAFFSLCLSDWNLPPPLRVPPSPLRLSSLTPPFPDYLHPHHPVAEMWVLCLCVFCSFSISTWHSWLSDPQTKFTRFELSSRSIGWVFSLLIFVTLFIKVMLSMFVGY